jgi:outer membrane protein
MKLVWPLRRRLKHHASRIKFHVSSITSPNTRHTRNTLRFALWIVGFTTVPAFAQFNTNLPARPLALQEALRLALEHNLQLEIARYQPEIARYNWQGAYGVYDPQFNANASHNLNVTEGGGVDPQGRATLGNETRSDRFGGGLRGVLPTGLLYDLSGTFGHNYGERESFPFDFYDGDVGLTLQQPLLRNMWIDANRLTIRVRKHDLKIAEQDYMFQVLQIVNDTQQAYYELIAARDQIVARERALELATRFADETQRRVELGTLPPLDHVQALSEASTVRAELIQVRQLAAVAENILKNLITDNYELWHASQIVPTERLVAVPEDLDLGASWLTGVSSRPDLLSLTERLERQGVVVKYQHNQLFPSLDLVGSLGRAGIDNKLNTIVITNVTPRPGPDIRRVIVVPGRDANFTDVLDDIATDNNPRYSYGIVFSMPLSFRRERNEYKAAKAEQESLKAQYTQLRQNILIQIENAVTEIRANFERVQATRQAAIFAEAALDAETKRMEAGRSTPFNVLQFQRDLTDARTAEIRALADYNRALTRLSFAEGSILTRNRITVDIR